MKLLVILILVGHEVSGDPKVSSEAKITKRDKTTIFNDTQYDKTEDKPDIIEKRNVHLLNHRIAKKEHHHQYQFISEELYDKPTRERETDKDFLESVIKEILSYNKFKHLILRDRHNIKKRLHFGTQLGYDEKESASVANGKLPVLESAKGELSHHGMRASLPKPRKRWKTTYRGHYVPRRSKRASKQKKHTSMFHPLKDNVEEPPNFSKKKVKNYKKVEERQKNMAMTLPQFLRYSIRDENQKDSGDYKRSPVNKEADMAKENVSIGDNLSKDLVNRIMSEIKLLHKSLKGNSKLYVRKILDIVKRKHKFLGSLLSQTCREAKMNHLIHGINTVYQRYLTNAECEGEYLDTGLDVLSWIVSNRKYIKRETELESNKGEIDSNGVDESIIASKRNRLQSSSDYSSGEARLSDSLENKRNRKTKHVKRSLTSDDIVNLASKDLKSNEDNQDLNTELLGKYIKSRLLDALRSIIYHRSDPYYREIEKLYIKQENTNAKLDFIRLVCEKIASEQFLHSVEAIIWNLIQNRDCHPGNFLKDEKHVNEIKPLTIDLSKHRIQPKTSNYYSFEETSEYDPTDSIDSTGLTDEGSLKRDTNFDKSDQNNEDTYSEYDAIPMKFKQFVIPISDINLRHKKKRFRDLTRLRNDKLRTIFGTGKINSLKVINQKLKDLNINDYKELMENLPITEKLLKIIYNKLPSQLQMILNVLKPGALKMIEDRHFSVKNVPTLLTEAFLKGKGKDLFKMMTDKLKHSQLKKVGKLFEKFQDKTRLLREIVQKVSELSYKNMNNTNLLLDKDQLQAKPRSSQLDTLRHIELISSFEKKDLPVVELTYVFNHPPVIHRKPKFFVKHNITYDQYLKNIKSIYNKDLLSRSNQIQLVKVVKKAGNDSLVFYETDVPHAAVEVSNKSAIIKLYNQFYNSTKNNNKNASSKDKIRKNDISRTAKEKFHTIDSTVLPIITLRSTEFKSKDAVQSILNDNRFEYKHNAFKSEEELFDDAKSAKVDNMAKSKSKPQLDNEVYFVRDGMIKWNNYPINRPMYYNNGRKKTQNHQKMTNNQRSINDRRN